VGALTSRAAFPLTASAFAFAWEHARRPTASPLLLVPRSGSRSDRPTPAARQNKTAGKDNGRGPVMGRDRPVLREVEAAPSSRAASRLQVPTAAPSPLAGV
jgi:hypothetical protein